MESKRTFELGVYTFGNTPRTADGGYGATAQAIRDALDAGVVADGDGQRRRSIDADDQAWHNGLGALHR